MTARQLLCGILQMPARSSSGPPSTSPEVDQLTHASRKVTEAWLRLGGRITFGGHPTITQHVLSDGRATCIEAAHERIDLYQSDFWPRQPELDGFEIRATIVSEPAIEGDREVSLEVMRRRMIAESDDVAAMTIGGRSDKGGTLPQAFLPRPRWREPAGSLSSLSGRPVGESALLAAEGQFASENERLNDESAEVNQLLATTDDYSDAAVMIWKSTVG